MKIAFYIVLVLYFLFYLIFSYKTGKFVNTVFKIGVIGISVLAIIHLFGGYLGFKVPLNIYTIGISAVMGLPGVLFVLIIPFII